MLPSPMAEPAKAIITAARLPKFSLSDIFVKFVFLPGLWGMPELAPELVEGSK